MDLTIHAERITAAPTSVRSVKFNGGTRAVLVEATCGRGSVPGDVDEDLPQDRRVLRGDAQNAF